MINWLKRIVPLVMLTAFIFGGTPPHLTASTTTFAYQIDQPTVPQIEAIYNFGVPTGNGTTPRHLAIDSQAGLVYILSEGISRLAEGNGLSLFDIETGQIVEHVKINEGANEPLDLQLDSTTGHIYTLWREQFTDTPATINVINSQSLKATQNIGGVTSMAVADGLLYTATDEVLTRFDSTRSPLIETEKIELSPATTGPLAVDPTNNRLYLARSTGGVWSLEIFTADTLEAVASYPAEGPILEIFPTPTTGELLLIANINEFMVLYRLTIEGELADFPFEIGPRYGATGIAMSPDERAIYFSQGQPVPAGVSPSDNNGPTASGLTVDTLLPLNDIPLLTTFEGIAIDADTNQAFALYPFDNLLYQIDLEQESYELIHTAINLRDILFDDESNRIYLSDTANRVRLLDSDTLEVLAETTLTGNLADYGFQRGRGSGELSIDPERERLYVSGYPATVLDSNELVELATLDLGGQIIPNPTNDEIYVSNCGVTIFEADTLSGDSIIPDSGPSQDIPGAVPDPCAIASQLDVENQQLYSIVSNRLPGSNSGTYLYGYDLSPEPKLVFTDTEITVRESEPDEVNQRAFVTYNRESHRRLRTLDMTASPAPAYTNQILGVDGDVRYNPVTDLLYLNDFDQPRLLTLEADTLNIVGETRLLPNYNYRLVEIDPATGRLFLIGLNGQLLVATSNGTPDPDIAAAITAAPEDPRLPDGAVLAVEFSGDVIAARINSRVGEFTSETRLYLSRDDGQTWTDLSEQLPQLPVNAVAISPNFESDQTIFAGLLAPGQTGGLYRSTDGGQSWQAAMNGLRDVWVEDLFISPNFSQDELIFARTTYAGLHQSSDGGQSWTPLAELEPTAPFPTVSSANTVAFSDNGVILTSQSLEDVIEGLFLTTMQDDGNLSEWLQVLDVSAELLALSPDGDVALAFANGLWHSADGGLTWEAVGAGLTGIDNLTPTNILFSPNFTDDQTAYFFFRDTSSGQTSLLFRSTDAGQTWQPWQKPFIGRNFAGVTFAPDGDFIFGEENGSLARLATSALVWTTPQLAPENFSIDDLAASPEYETDQTLFVVNGRQGLYKTTDGGQNWNLTDFPVRSAGYSLTKYRLAVSPNFAEDETLYVATGRSLHRSTDGGDTWQQTPLDIGPSSESLTFPAQQIVFSPNFVEDQTLLAAIPQIIYRSTDGGQRWREVLIQPNGGSTADLLAIAPDGDTIYTRSGYSQSLLVSPDSGQNWQAQTSPDEYFTVVSSTVGQDGTLSVALEFDTRLLQTDPQIQGWQTIASPPELTSLTAITTIANNVLLAGGQGGLFRSEDNGQSWQPVAADGLSQGSEITSLDVTASNLFATTLDGKIFVSADEGQTWQDISVVK